MAEIATAFICLTAALALAERERVVLVKVPGHMGRHTLKAEGQYREGFDACRASTLAGKVTL